MVAGLTMGLGLYSAIYFPYPEHSIVAAYLRAYLQIVAQLSAEVIRTFDSTAYADGEMILGQFPLHIVLDCAALDAQVLLSVAILVAPGSLARKLAGVVMGGLLLFGANIVRIALLAAIGAHRPKWFSVMHEEVFQFGLVLLACGLFWLWLHGTGQRQQPGAALHA